MSEPTTYPEIIKAADMSIALLWMNFAGFVVPADAPEIQREEMKKAFYAGFTECFKVITDYSTVLPEAEGTALLSRLAEESHAYYLRMKAELSRTTPTTGELP